MKKFSSKSNLLTLLQGFASIAFALIIAQTTLHAEDPQPPSLSEKTSEMLQKLKPLQEAKNYDGMLDLVNAQIPLAAPNSYDLTTLLDMKAKLYLQKSDYANALEPMESALRIADQNKFYDARTTLETVDLLSRLYYSEAGTTKVSGQQQQYINKSAQMMKRWLKATPKSNPESALFYASILYSQATANPEKVDKLLLDETRTVIENGLLTAIRPREGFYVVLLATLQQEGDVARSAEILELLVKQHPDNKTYWQQLLPTYLNLANDKNERKSRENYLRATNVIERAQTFGHMKSPKDNYNLVTIYFTLNQFGRATDLLYSGLKTNLIESDLKNWFLLSYSYQQVNQEKDAIRVLKEASQLFPLSGQVDFQIGQIYQQLENTKEANIHYQKAVLKGELDKAYLVYMFLAYTSFELGQLEDALKAVEKAYKYKEAEKDAQLPKLKAGIEDAIKQRAADREAASKNKL